MRLDNWVKVKKKEKETKRQTGQQTGRMGWQQIVKKAPETLRHKTFRVIKDIGEVMAIDEQGQVYVEVLKKGDIISGERFDEMFLRVLVDRKIVEEVKRWSHELG